MSHQFANHGLIVVPVRVYGPKGKSVLRLALDTGATTTMLNVAPLVALGYDPGASPERIEVTTGSGVEYVPRLRLLALVALGQSNEGVPVLAHTLPPSASVDGLLGLDFLRPHVLRIDFPQGLIDLS